MDETIPLLKDNTGKELVERMCREADVSFDVFIGLVQAALESQGKPTNYHLNKRIDQIIDDLLMENGEDETNDAH